MLAQGCQCQRRAVNASTGLATLAQDVLCQRRAANASAGLSTLAQGCQRQRRAVNAKMCKNDVFVAKICNCKIRCFLSRKFANARSALALRDIWRSPLARQLIAACNSIGKCSFNAMFQNLIECNSYFANSRQADAERNDQKGHLLADFVWDF